MTEEEWLAATDPAPSLEFLRGKAGSRKLRLFAVACCRRVWHLLHDERSRNALECSERFADGEIDKAQLSASRKGASDWLWQSALKRSRGRHLNKPTISAAEAVTFVASATSKAAVLFDRMRTAASSSLSAELLDHGSTSVQPELQRCHLLRDIFGNPFRPVTLNPSWLTSTVLALANGIYQDKDFDSMPILADALQEAGCDNGELLNHCRESGEHVRGCWVIDIILSK